ncbi:ImmA/IrrE family metallo-endopeptidase [Chryseobacterium potabilaquae]|nr:ImmA/IrrE family metallo-endopeptidase [Chryseobacterium potabilaquae]
MSTRVENINSEIIEWAIMRNGNSLDEFFIKNPEVRMWIEGEKYPTVKQLEKFTHKVHVPFGYMFLPNPPEETVPLPFFRTLNEGGDNTISLNVFHTVQIIQERQNWLTEYLDDLELPDLDFVGKFNVRDDYREIVHDIKSTLGLADDWASYHKNWEDCLEFLTNKIEELGIIVTFNGIVGLNTHRPLAVKECRGFVLVDRKAPFLFINSADAKSAQMFTLIHELAHVWLGESAGFDNQNLLPADHPLEILCDKIAAEFLVPETIFKVFWHKNKDLRFLSNRFKVSQIVIARRALDLKLISRKDFLNFYNIQMQEFRNYREKLKDSDGGNFYATAKKRVSLRFASFVEYALKHNKLLYRDAYKLTSLKGDTYNRFVNEYLYK